MITKEDLISFETDMRILWHTGKIKCPHHFCGGNEGQLIEYFRKHVRPDDWVFSTHRNAYHWLLKTGDVAYLEKQILKHNNSMHIIDVKRRFISTAIVGGNVGPAVGVAKAIKIAGSLEHVHCFVGDGATDQGWFWEAYRYANFFDLPITFIIEDNNRSVESNKAARWGHPFRFDFINSQSHKIYYYQYTPTYPHCGDGRAIEW